MDDPWNEYDQGIFSLRPEDHVVFFNLDAVAAYRLNRVEFFLKVTNIFDKFIYTELGFPWRGRYFEFGFRADLLNR